MQLKFTIDEMPENSEILIISSFNPSFWKTHKEDTMEKITVTKEDEGKTFSFKSTNEVFLVTRCIDNCVKSVNAEDSSGPV